MLKAWRALLLVLCLSLFGNEARAGAWEDLGGVLRSACGVAGGAGVAGVQIGAISSLDFLCTISRMYGFVNNAILNGDWASFAREVAGKYVTDLANYAGKELGLNTVNQWANAADDWMRGSYRDFKRQLMYAMSDAIKAQNNNPRDENARFPISTAGGLAHVAKLENPMLQVGDTVAQSARTASRFESLRVAAKAQAFETQSNESISTNLSEVLKKGTQVIGIHAPGVPAIAGEADQFVNKAATAVSTREIMQTQVEATSSLMRQHAVYFSGLMNQLSFMAKQDVMTNNQLMQLVGKLAGDHEQQVNQIDYMLEQQAQESLDEAREIATQLTISTRQAQGMFDGSIGQGLDPGALAP